MTIEILVLLGWCVLTAGVWLYKSEEQILDELDGERDV